LILLKYTALYCWKSCPRAWLSRRKYFRRYWRIEITFRL